MIRLCTYVRIFLVGVHSVSSKALSCITLRNAIVTGFQLGFRLAHFSLPTALLFTTSYVQCFRVFHLPVVDLRLLTKSGILKHSEPISLLIANISCHNRMKVLIPLGVLLNEPIRRSFVALVLHV